MKTIKVDFLRFKNFWVVRVLSSKKYKGGDYLQPTLQKCYEFVEKLNNNK